MSGAKKVVRFVLVILVLLGVLFLGLALGRKQGVETGKQEVKQKLEPIVEKIFPKPPEEIKSLSGAVKKVYGGIIEIEINDPEDYLPHEDGTPPKKQNRLVITTSATKIVRINPLKLNAQGNPETTLLKITDLAVGDGITVRSNINIRSLQKFDVTDVELVKY